MIAFSIWSINIYWYGIFYAVSFLIWYYYISLIIKKKLVEIPNPKEFPEDLMLYSIIWVLLWWRLWYVLIYNIGYFIENPLKIFYIWEWGMAFIWAFIWVTIAVYLLAKKYKISIFTIGDMILSFLPLGLGLGRIWNYLNKELYWIKCNNFLQENVWLLCKDFGDWEMKVVSQLLESLWEGWILLFVMQYLIWKKWLLKKSWRITAIFFIWYGIFRFLIEFVREHPAIDYIWPFSKTQYFMIVFVILWTILLNFGWNKE